MTPESEAVPDDPVHRQKSLHEDVEHISVLVDAPLREQVLHVTDAAREPVVQPNAVTDDVARESTLVPAT